ncbi:Saccharopine dehydrogenase-like oxidoreductase [Takifugu flavidus]|uniref:Saccharopine dehydrogenase-like oxidoreductase n=1 Tax=Takifugu flavidus TaxID=433684 RepID=A0A5C6NKY9_9TELE|nr:Saccharopine dehydrogenase-like oxidoreductase [Takifugu flavidus]
MARFEATSSRPYHLVIFGASGFTGQFVVEEVARTVSEGPQGTLKWAVAGRSKQKLEKVVEQAACVLGKPELSSEVDIIVADVAEPDSLASLCKQAVIILNCVGPYRFFGEPVVKACVENGTHHVDISGEPQFLEGMQLNYNSQAAENGVYIIGSCGFDSIPADMGVLYTRDQFKGILTTVESFLTIKSGPNGGCVHDGTWQSAVYGFADSQSLQSLRRKFNHNPLPIFGTKLKRSNEIREYTVPFIGSDPSVVKRTQRYLMEEYQATPVQYGAYAGIGGIGSIIKLMFAGMMFWLLVKFHFGRNLLIKREERGRERRGRGEETRGEETRGDQTMTQWGDRGLSECGYVATPITMVQAALTLLSEPSALPNKGGVYTPGAAFAKTTLIDRLKKHGIQFSVI